MEKGKVVPPTTFPHCIVWTPIPLISWLVPFIGHMGICTSKGVIMDFAADYTIKSGSLTFGTPARYRQLDPTRAATSNGAPASPKLSAVEQTASNEQWDAAMHRTVSAFQECKYNFLTVNCHAFVAHFMNELQYGGRKNWNMVHLATMIALTGRFTGVWGFIKTFLPFVAIMVVGLYFGTWIFATAYTGVIAPISLWFFIYTYCISRRAGKKPTKGPA